LYEAAQDLQYLDMVLQETMRLYTPVPRSVYWYFYVDYKLNLWNRIPHTVTMQSMFFCP